MPDLREELGRLADFVGEPGSFRDLERARRRRERRRRTGGLVAGLAVFAAAALFLTTTLLNPPTTTPGDSPPPLVGRSAETVWPENAINGGSAEQVQAALDSGDDSLRWRTDPSRVVERFGQHILGRSMRVVDVQVDDQIATIHALPCLAGEDPVSVSCDAPSGDPLTFELVQPAVRGATGIWSVGSVTSAPLAVGLGVASGDPISEGDEVSFGVASLPVAATAHAGIVASNGCNVVHAADDLTGNRNASLRVPQVYQAGPDCAAQPGGYAFAYVTDDTTLPTPDPLEEPTAIEHPWLTIVPFTLDADALAIVTPTPQPSTEATSGPSSTNAASCDPTSPKIVEEGITLSGCTEWAAGVPLRLEFVNRDADTMEGVYLFEPSMCDADGCTRDALWKSDLIHGPDTFVGTIPALPSGSYVLVDPVHPRVRLEITVK